MKKNRSMSKRANITFSVFIGVIFAFVTSCNQDKQEVAPEQKDEQKEHSSSNLRKVLETKLSPTALATFYEQDGEVFMSVDAHMDKDEKIMPILQRAINEKSIAKSYRILQSINHEKGDVPLVISDLARKYDGKLGTESATTSKEDIDESSKPSSFSNSRINATEPPWDWTGDANWFTDVVRSNASGQHEYIRTNVGWAWVQRKGYHHVAFGMAASHIATAKFEGWYESCGLFECDWNSHFNVTIQPRYYKWYSWKGSSQHRLRKFSVTGNEPSPRIHIGLKWDTELDEPTPTGPDLSITISSYNWQTRAFTWYVKNTGTTTIYRPWIKFNYRGTPLQVDEWQIPASLAPGQTYGDTRTWGTYHVGVGITIDSKNLIQETNEFNNYASTN